MRTILRDAAGFGIFLLGLSPVRGQSASTCSPTAFSSPEVFGAEILAVEAAEVEHYDAFPKLFLQAGNLDPSKINFCNVTVTYTHPGQNDRINVQVWLPLKGWNGRFQGTGGGGFSTGMINGDLISAAVHEGFAAASTDGGHDPANAVAAPWALLSPGNINYALLYDFAYVSLHDMTVIGKQIVQQYYGKPPTYSYWNGCSTGGRQGVMFAQRYPEDYDGILAAAPAIYWSQLVAATYWPQHVMNIEKVYPKGCELDAITAAAIEACDELDGVKDGIISAPESCSFDAQTVVGKAIDCDGKKIEISAAAVKIAKATWEGPRRADGKMLWYGLPVGAPLTGPYATVNTRCDDKGCSGQPFPIPIDWMRLFLQKDANFNVEKMSNAEFEKMIRLSVQQYNSIIGTDDPDLSEFRDAGRKMITWHGIHDELIPVNGTRRYYEQVLAGDPNAKEYYRYFEAPGVGHCGGGTGTYPYDALAALVRWTEKGITPEQLSTKVQGKPDDDAAHRPLCLYPLVASYTGGDIDSASSYVCAETFNVKSGRDTKDEL